ncbi:MAG: type IV pilus assembly protein PilM [Verrucomicrobiota bacterium]
MLNSKSFISLDFGAGSLKMAEFELNEAGSLLLKHFGIKSLGLEGSQDSKREGVILKAIQELMAEKPNRAKNTNVCAPGFHVFSKFVKLPPVDASKVTQIIQYEAQQNVPFPLEEVVWDYQILGTTPTGELEVLLVAIKSDVVEGLFRTAEAAGLRLQLVDVSPAALCNAFRFNYGDLEGCTMLLDIGAKTSNLLFFEKGKVYSRGINIGANSITQDFATESKLPFVEAEQLKINEGFVSLGGAYEEPDNPRQAQMSKIARQVMTRLHIQVNQTIQFYRGQQGGSAPQRLFLAGGASIMPYTAQFFAEKLNVAVEYFNPFRSVQIDPAINLEGLAKVAHSFGEVVGLGLRNMAQCPVELNLVPKSIRKRQQFEQKKPYFIAAVFSLVLVVFAYGWFYGQVAGIKQEALSDLSAKLTPLTAKAEELKKQEDQVKKTKEQIDQLSTWLEDRFAWGDILTETRRLLIETERKLTRPGQEIGVWIETFGTVAPEIPSEEDSYFSPYSMGYNPYMMDPMLAARYGLMPPNPYMQNPYMQNPYMQNPYMQRGGEGGAPGMPGAPGMMPGMPGFGGARKPVATNEIDTVNIKLRAVNLSRSGDPSLNGRLAFAVENEFKASKYYDKAGTKLSGDLEQVDVAAETFGFGMTLKLKKPIKL